MNEAVLIVDDSLTVRMDLAEAFQAAGFQPFTCASLEEARETLSRVPVRAIILDVLLPDGDGVEFLQETRASSNVVVLMLSSEAEVKDRVRALRTGADEYVGKPYDTGYVVAKTREFLRARVSQEPAGKATVLVIDDSVTFREELRRVFEQEGHNVLIASSGEEGLRIAAGHRPSAIVVDGVLPGIDGATVIRRVRLDAALRRIPCLLLTASDDRNAELFALEAGADAFVRKEEDVEVISAKLTAALRGSDVRADDAVSALGPRKILAVDDSSTYLQALASELRAEGYDVSLARSGEEALELLSVERVDCVLLDVVMPGMSGREACRRIKAVPSVRDTPLILLSSLDDRTAMLEGMSAGADDYVPKSSEMDVLKARIRAQIRRKQFEDETRRAREDMLHRELAASEARAAKELAETRAALVQELERKNQELEAFSYSVSHDLRAPLRSIDGFCQALVEEYSEKLDAEGQRYLTRVRASARRMAELIDDMLQLSRVARAELRMAQVDVSGLVREVIADLERYHPERRVEVSIESGVVADADERLLKIVFENLLGNAWKFTGKVANPKIEFYREQDSALPVFVVRDNGAGFNMEYAQKLFRPFQRLHTDAEFSGTGIGLATIHRIVDRHGGRIWAESAPGKGATFRFTLARHNGARR